MILRKMDTNDKNQYETTWDVIAESFDKTRKKPWPQVTNFVNKISQHTIIADIGCGNGRHLIPSAKHCKHVIGIDISKKMLTIAQNNCIKNGVNNVNFINANMVNIPLKNDSINAIICIASIHNLNGRNTRIRALKEINRILKIDGKALISVWSRWQEKYRAYFLKKIISNKEEFGDIHIHWRQHNLNIPRFYHLYSKREFIIDIKHANLRLQNIARVNLHSKRSADNFFAVVQKG
jgi:ubiquinone/menaquinone biosynthesis C-methylase UbiE